MKASPAKFEQDLKAGRLAAVYLLHGQESLLIDRALERLLTALVDPRAADFNLELLNAAEVSPGEVMARLAQFPLLGGRRVVAVRHLEEVDAEWREEFLTVFERPPEASHLILSARAKLDARGRFFKAVDNIGLVVNFNAPSEQDLLDWLATEARARGKSIEPEAEALLLTRVGANLAELSNELDKLALFVAERKGSRRPTSGRPRPVSGATRALTWPRPWARRTASKP